MPASSYSGVPLNQMFLSLENPRFDPVNNQVDAIGIMLVNQGENLVRRAENILKNGLNPNDLTLHTRLKRLTRRTICFSKSAMIHDTLIGLFTNHYFFEHQRC